MELKQIASKIGCLVLTHFYYPYATNESCKNNEVWISTMIQLTCTFLRNMSWTQLLRVMHASNASTVVQKVQ
jgi:hypothetical protein